MNSRIKVLSLVVVASVIGYGAVSTVTASAVDLRRPVHTAAEMADRLDELKVIIANKDFEAWKKHVLENSPRPEILKIIDTQAEFEKLMYAQSLRIAGEYEKSREIKNELGLTRHDGTGRREERGQGLMDGSGQGRMGRDMGMRNK